MSEELPPPFMTLLGRMRNPAAADPGPPQPLPEVARRLRTAIAAWAVQHDFEPGDLVRHKAAVLSPSTVMGRGCPGGVFYVVASRPEARRGPSKNGRLKRWHDVELAFLDPDGDLVRMTSDSRFLEPIPAEELAEAPAGEKPHRGQITNWYREVLPGVTSGLGYVVCGRLSSNGEHHRTEPVIVAPPTDGPTVEIETAEYRYTLVGPDLKAA